MNDRLSGFDARPLKPGESPLLNWGRDRTIFRDFYLEYDAPIEGAQARGMVCTAPITYQGHAAVQSDIDNFNAALATVDAEEAFIPAVAPGTIELQRTNEYYPTQEEYLAAIADAMKQEYRAIVEAGFILQIDDPRVVTQYGMPDPAPSIEEYRNFASLRVEAINHALAGLPEDRVRYHLCWGSWHGPHVTDVPLKDIVDIVLQVNAGAYCVEAANPRHAHEWEVWENRKLPDGKILIPGVVAQIGGAGRRSGTGLPAIVGLTRGPTGADRPPGPSRRCGTPPRSTPCSELRSQRPPCPQSPCRVRHW